MRTLLILIASAVLCTPAYGQSGEASSNTTPDVPPEMFTILRPSYGDAAFVVAKRELEGPETGIQAQYQTASGERVRLMVNPYRDDIREQMEKMGTPATIDGMPDGVDGFTTRPDGEGALVALDEPNGFVVFVEAPTADQTAEILRSLVDRAAQPADRRAGSAGDADASAMDGVTAAQTFFRILPVRVGEMELLRIGQPPRAEEMRAEYVADDDPDVRMQVMVYPEGHRMISQLDFAMKTMDDLRTDTTMAGRDVVLIRAGESGNALGSSTDEPMLLMPTEGGRVAIVATKEREMADVLRFADAIDLGALAALPVGEGD